MKTIKTFYYLVKYFGFITAIKVWRICHSDNWYLYNWWQYGKSISSEPINETTDNRWYESKYNWHIPTKEDYKDIKEFVKMYN